MNKTETRPNGRASKIYISYFIPSLPGVNSPARSEFTEGKSRKDNSPARSEFAKQTS